MLLRRFYDDGLAQASFMLGCQATGEALIVDPNRDVDQYVAAADAEGLRITHITRRHTLSLRGGWRGVAIRLPDG